MTTLARLACLFALACGAAPPSESADRFEPFAIPSPDGRVTIEFDTRTPSSAAGQLTYQVSLSGRTVIEASGFGVRLTDGTELGRNTALLGVESTEIDASFEQFPGKRRQVTDRARETTLRLREIGSRPLEWQLIVRAYDDGVALRYRFPAQPGWPELALADESTEFNFPAQATATILPLANFTTSHEGRYERHRVEDIPSNTLFGLPMLVELPGVAWAAVLEANLTDYAGLYLARDPAARGTLMSRLSPRRDEQGIAVRARLPHASPWRLILVTAEARQLLESDTVLKLNAPSAIHDTSWIQPGLTTFPWWNDFFEAGVPFKMGLNTETAKHYIDFCAEYGIPYHTLDGLDGVAWYDGPITPYEGAHITRGIDGLDLQAVIAHARQKGVRLRLWMHWQAAQQHMARAFPLYRAWGIEGVMIDFMDRDDQEMVNFQRELLQLAADNRLTVTFHGVAAPTGLERTFPNLLNSEAVLNLEHNKWDEAGVTSDHDIAVALTRMLAGPLDYHQGSFRGVPADRFKPRMSEPLVIGSPMRMLASYVVFQNHLPMAADYPSAYRRQPLTRVLAEVPATWDDTKVISARLNEEVVIARKSGNDWWIGALTGHSARHVQFPLAFLMPGTFRADIYQDDSAAEHGFSHASREVSPADVLDLRLTSAGGALVRLTPAPAPAPRWRLAWTDDFDPPDPDAWQAGDGKFVSVHAQRLGRWEVRARLRATPAAPSFIRLQPDAPWPTEGGIDIVHQRGDQPTITESAFHWVPRGARAPQSFAFKQQTAIDDKLVSYGDGFHVFACEWVANQLRFYVDDVYHAMIYNDEAGYFLPHVTAPMRLVIDGADVDWVRVYELAREPGEMAFQNGGFDENGGSAAGWHLFGNPVDGNPNVRVQGKTRRDGTHALRISGQGTEANYSGASQGVSVAPGQRVRARLSALVRSDDRLTNPDDRAYMKFEFYNHWGEYFGGPAMEGVTERAIADSTTTTDAWQEFELEAVAPPGSVEARLTLVFGQAADAPGSVYIDAVEFKRIP
jgi:alpha-glucosidase